MQKSIFEGRFYETYYFAHLVSDVLHDQFAHIRLLAEFYGDDQYFDYTKPFPKHSALHCFIEFLILRVLNDEIGQIRLDSRQDEMERYKNIPAAIDDLRPHIFPINEALNHYGINYISFVDWLADRGTEFLNAKDDDVSDYYQELMLDECFDRLMSSVTGETFFVLFQNRGLLLIFNEMLARVSTDDDSMEVTNGANKHLASNGRLKRATIPRWVKRAVYFRDRGFCVICQKDLSGILNIGNTENFDHVVPLVRGGLNDVGNIQLLCQSCNAKKKGQPAVTSNVYEAWY